MNKESGGLDRIEAFLPLCIARLSGKNLISYIEDSDGNNSKSSERHVLGILREASLPKIREVKVMITDKKGHYENDIRIRGNFS